MAAGSKMRGHQFFKWRCKIDFFRLIIARGVSAKVKGWG